MKKILLSILLCLFIQFTNAQIALLGKIPHTYLDSYHFKNAGDKIIYENNVTDTLIMFNYDGSIFKIISIPPQNFGGTYGYHVYALSEDLFDTDSSTFEYIQNISGNGPTYFRIYREDGTLLFARDSFGWNGPIELNKDGVPILRIQRTTPPIDSERTEIYSLPGKIDCIPTCSGGGNFPLNIENNSDGSGLTGWQLNSIPNPSNTATKVFYDLPANVSLGYLIFYNLNGVEVKRFEVSNLFQYVLVSTDNLPAGTYVYHIETSHGSSMGKEQIVVR